MTGRQVVGNLKGMSSAMGILMFILVFLAAMLWFLVQAEGGIEEIPRLFERISDIKR